MNSLNYLSNENVITLLREPGLGDINEQLRIRVKNKFVVWLYFTIPAWLPFDWSESQCPPCGLSIYCLSVSNSPFFLLCENESGPLKYCFYCHLALKLVHPGIWTITAGSKGIAFQVWFTLSAVSYRVLASLSTRFLQHLLLLQCLTPALHVNQQDPQASCCPLHFLFTLDGFVAGCRRWDIAFWTTFPGIKESAWPASSASLAPRCLLSHLGHDVLSPTWLELKPWRGIRTLLGTLS